MQNKSFSAEFLAPSAADNSPVIAELTDLVNSVYEKSEAGLWVEGAARRQESEMRDLIRAGEIAVVRNEGKIVGCIRVHRVDKNTMVFGTLAVRSDDRGAGIGKKLIQLSEKWVADSGATKMRLNILVPKSGTVPDKEFLKKWYGEMGYQMVRQSAADVVEPALHKLLAQPCEFLVYEKKLLSSP